VRHVTIARRRLGERVPGVTLSTTEGHPLLGNVSINKHSRTIEEKCFPWGPCRRNIRESNSEARAVGAQRRTENENGASRQQSRNKGSAENFL
jgi:hypothetical protein